MMALLEVSELCVRIETKRGVFSAVDRLSFSVGQGETLGIVGESGCGKSITSLALMGLLPPNIHVSASRLEFGGRELTALSKAQRRAIRGAEMTMIFQDPMSSLNPSFTVGFQIDEMLKAHGGGGTRRLRRSRAAELLERVGIEDPSGRLEAYPHQLSGGMSQRVMIAMAIACHPRLLIADEPTTALDVTIQKQILDLLKELQAQQGMALILITHDIGVVARMADRMLVMYAGQAVEAGETKAILENPLHPYTHGLLECLPASHTRAKERLSTIAGLVPDLVSRPPGCQFHPRCERAAASCRGEEPLLESRGERQFRCLFPLEGGAR